MRYSLAAVATLLAPMTANAETISLYAAGSLKAAMGDFARLGLVKKRMSAFCASYEQGFGGYPLQTAVHAEGREREPQQCAEIE